MTNEKLSEEIAIWNRWSYSFIKHEITCFTDHIIDFDEKTNMWKITYKPKTWFKSIPFEDFLKLYKIPKLHKTYRWFRDDWFTEEEPGEECDPSICEYFKKFY